MPMSSDAVQLQFASSKLHDRFPLAGWYVVVDMAPVTAAVDVEEVLCIAEQGAARLVPITKGPV